MAFFANRGINRLALHIGLHQFAWCTSGVFFGVYLLRSGLSPAVIFLTGGATLLLRFLVRPVILFVVPRLGLRRTLAIGTLFSALQYPAIGFVHGAGGALAAFAAIGAIAGIFYWPCYHAFFAAIGDTQFRGSQIGIRQLAMGLAAVLGPVLGGLMLTAFGPWVAFGAAAAIEGFAILPLLGVDAPPARRLCRGPDRRAAFRHRRLDHLLRGDRLGYRRLPRAAVALRRLRRNPCLGGAGRSARRRGARPLHRSGPYPPRHLAQRAGPGLGVSRPGLVQHRAAGDRRRRGPDHHAERYLRADADDRVLQRRQIVALPVPLPVRGRGRLGSGRRGREPCRRRGLRRRISAADRDSPGAARRADPGAFARARLSAAPARAAASAVASGARSDPPAGGLGEAVAAARRKWEDSAI